MARIPNPIIIKYDDNVIQEVNRQINERLASCEIALKKAWSSLVCLPNEKEVVKIIEAELKLLESNTNETR